MYETEGVEEYQLCVKMLVKWLLGKLQDEQNYIKGVGERPLSK